MKQLLKIDHELKVSLLDEAFGNKWSLKKNGDVWDGANFVVNSTWNSSEDIDSSEQTMFYFYLLPNDVAKVMSANYCDVDGDITYTDGNIADLLYSLLKITFVKEGSTTEIATHYMGHEAGSTKINGVEYDYLY